MLTWHTAGTYAALGSATNSDGRKPKRQPRIRFASVLLILGCFGALAPSAHAAGRILFSSDWSGQMEIYAVDPARPAAVRQLTFGSSPGCGSLMTACGAIDALPSPDERQVVYRRGGPACSNTFWVTRRGGGTPILLGEARRSCYPSFAPDAAWSPDSRRIAFLGTDGLHVVRSDGTQNLIVSPDYYGTLEWAPTSNDLLATGPGGVVRIRGTTIMNVPSTTKIARSPNGRWLASFDDGGVLRFDRTNGSKHWLTRIKGSFSHAWSPDSRHFAFIGTDGLWVFDVKSGKPRRLTTELAPDRYAGPQNAYRFAWLDARTLAYIAGRLGIWDITSGPIRSVTVTGRVRTLLSADARYMGRTLSVAVIRNAGRLPVRAPNALERVGRDSALAEGPIDEIAVDGDTVAFTACLDAYAWTRSTGTVRTLSGAKPGGCNWEDRSYYYSLAVDGTRVATAYRAGCTGVLSLTLTSLSSLARTELERSNVTCASAMHPALDDLEGENGLLVYSTAEETQPCCPLGTASTARQEIRRVGPSGCPCPVIASSPGTLVPSDVAGGRILAYGRNETWLLDREGNRLLTIPIGPLGAQLSLDNLVLLLRGQLQVYSTRPAGLVRTITLPDVPSSGHECELRCDHRGVELTLEDVGHGRALYLLNGQLHMIGIDRSPGRDEVVGPATTARFTQSGLVYADGSRLFFIPDTAFP